MELYDNALIAEACEFLEVFSAGLSELLTLRRIALSLNAVIAL